MFESLFDFDKSPVVKLLKPKPKPDYQPFITIHFTEEDFKIMNDLKILTSHWDEKVDVDNKALSGEFKRHQVYAKIFKMFPHVPKQHLSLLIELVVGQHV